MKLTVKDIDGGVCAPKGFRAASVHCGIKDGSTKDDLALILSEKRCHAAAIYTTNKVQGAPIVVTRENLTDGYARAVIVNSGNANTCNANGEEIAKAMCKLVAERCGCREESVIVASTGVIGQPMSIEPIENGMDELVNKLSSTGSDMAATAIMTTDTVKKQAAVSFMLGDVECRIGAIAKGSGMIEPNMATMLCFVTTDVAITSYMIDKALRDVADRTFNMVSVDGDCSTNDTMSIMANGLSGNRMIDCEDGYYHIFVTALYKLSEQMAKMLASDGEGATKLLTVNVTGAPYEEAARSIAKSVVNSSLLKCAIFGEDANWGRILCAIGYTKGDFSIAKTAVDISSKAGSIAVCKNGAGVSFSEEKASEILAEHDIEIDIYLCDGEFGATAWGCDLTYDYVKINGDYRS